MTSEGQHAGQPAEATSGGGGTEPATTGSAYGTPRVAGDFSPHPDDQPPSGPSGAPQAAPQAGWGPDAYPNSYGPPPYPATGSGSPFVVPAVPVAGASHDEARGPGAAGGRPAAATFRSSAQVPLHTGDGAAAAPDAWDPDPGNGRHEPSGGPAEAHPYRAEPHPYRVTPVAEEQGPVATPRSDHPYRATASAAGSASVPMASPPPMSPPPMSPPAVAQPQVGQSHVAQPHVAQPQVAQPQVASLSGDGERGQQRDAVVESPSADGRMAPGGPLPSRADRLPFGGPDGPGNPDAMSGFNGFVSSTPGRRPAEADQPGENRPPGISAFGGQRVRVPGAALSGLSDAPPAGQTRPTDSGGFHLRGSGDAAPGDEAGFSALPQPRTPTDQPPATSSGPPHVAQAHPGQAAPHQAGPYQSSPGQGDPFQSGPDQAGPYQANPYQAVPYQAGSGQAGSGQAGSGQAGTAGQAAPAVAVGSARPVTASASVPVTSRVPPPADVEDVPVSEGAAARPRVYGRAAPSDDQDSPAPVSPFQSRFGDDAHPYRGNGNGQASSGTDYPPPTGRASASARVAPPSGGTAGFVPGSPPPSYPAPGAPSAYSKDAGTPYPPAGGSTAFPPAAPPAFPPGGPDAQVAKSYSEHTTDVSGRGRSTVPTEPAGPGDTHLPTTPFTSDGSFSSNGPFTSNGFGAGSNGNGAAPFSEHTMDVSRRSGAPDHPYAPPMAGNRPDLDGFAPTDPHRRMERPPSGGVFPEPANRATVTPPGAAETTSWPAPGSEQSRFDAFKPEELDGTAAVPVAEPAADKPEATNVRMLPVLLGVILAAALLVGMAIGIVWLIARPGDTGFDVSAGECVKRNGDKAVTATCGDPGSYQVVSKVDDKKQCADPGQPYVLNPAGDGRSQVLCLKPN